MASKPSVVIVGGGFAGIHAALRLKHHLTDRVALTVVSREERFPFGSGVPDIASGADLARDEFDLRRFLGRSRIRFVKATVESVDLPARRIFSEGTAIAFDELIVATGALNRPQDVLGLEENAAVAGRYGDSERFDLVTTRILARAGRGQTTHLLFVVARTNRSRPRLEVALAFEEHLRRAGVRDLVTLTWASHEAHCDAEQAVFAARGIALQKRKLLIEVMPGRARFACAEDQVFDEMIAFPPQAAAVRFEALPIDERGFIHVVPQTRAVAGVDHVFAPGDAGISEGEQVPSPLLQAEATVESIVSRLGANPSDHARRASSLEVGALLKSAPISVATRLGGR